MPRNKKNPRARLRADPMFVERMEQQNGLCFWCNQPMGLRTVTREHFIPRSKDGADDWTNIVLAHKTCNNRRASTLPDEEEIARFNLLVLKGSHHG